MSEKNERKSGRQCARGLKGRVNVYKESDGRETREKGEERKKFDECEKRGVEG